MQLPTTLSFLPLFLLPLSTTLAADLGSCAESEKCGFFCCGSNEVCVYSAICHPIPAISSALASLPTATLKPDVLTSALNDAAASNVAALASLVDKYQPTMAAPGTVIGLDGKPIVMPTPTGTDGNGKDGDAVFSIALPTTATTQSAKSSSAKSSEAASSTSSTSTTATSTERETTATSAGASPTEDADSGVAPARLVNAAAGLAAMGLAIAAGLL